MIPKPENCNPKSDTCSTEWDNGRAGTLIAPRKTCIRNVVSVCDFFYSDLLVRKGFTLIELVIVIGMIGLLASVLVTLINPLDQLKKSNDAERKSDLSQLRQALEIYYQDNGRYPASSVDFKISPTVNGSMVTLAWGSPWTPYINIIPKDPKPPRTYIYSASVDGQTFYLYANLERGAADPQACNSGNACSNAPTTCGNSLPCNFGLTSPNVTP